MTSLIQAPDAAMPETQPRKPVARERHDGANPRSGSQFSIVVLRHAAELAAHVPAWEGLAAQALEPNPFYEPWMLLPATQTLAKKTDLTFVLVYKAPPAHAPSAPTLCGFFPVERLRRFRNLPVRALRLWQHRYCFLCVPLLHRDHARETLGAFFAWLETEPTRGMCLELPHISAEGAFHHFLISAVNERQRTSVVTASFCRALFRPGEKADAYLLSAFSGEQRKKLRQRSRRLAEIGKLEYVSLEQDGDQARWVDNFMQLEASGWKGQQHTALSSHAADRQFFSQVAQEAHRRGRLQLTALQVNGQPIAMQCCFAASPGLFTWKTAFDEQYASHAPGILLQVELIRRFHQDPRPEWVDSCAEPGSYLESLWMDRKAMQTLVVATRSGLGDFLVSALPLLRCIKRYMGRRRGRGVQENTP
jgi:CelD/BcsL family acetyltransferase involved in cellulose biosynthesis